MGIYLCHKVENSFTFRQYNYARSFPYHRHYPFRPKSNYHFTVHHFPRPRPTSTSKSIPTGGTSLDVTESYKLVLSSSLSSRSLGSPITFCSNSSRPMTFLGLSKDRCSGLLGFLLNFIFENFRVCSRPGSYLVRATSGRNRSEKGGKKVVFVGASNLSHCVPH